MPSDGALLDTVLLDTVVVAGLFAISKSGKYVDSNRSSWSTAITTLLARAKISRPKLQIPVSVCFELKCWSRTWYDFVNSTSHPAFKYSNTHIINTILDEAAKFAIACRMPTEDEKTAKLKTFDPITAAYCLMFNFCLITENQQDFPESHFRVIGSESVVLFSRDGDRQNRRTIYLLTPITR